MTNRTFYIRGAMGDIIYSLPTIRALGGGVIYNGLPIRLHAALKPLIDVQSYVQGFFHESQGLPPNFINLEDFVYLQCNPWHICESFAKIFQQDIEYKDGWLVPITDKITARLIGPSYAAINVTGRYRDKLFNWRREVYWLLRHTEYHKVCFIGTKQEYAQFICRWGNDGTTWVNTENMLEAARIIQNAKYFSGTQSACLAIAEGLGRPYRFERSPFFDNCRLNVPRETVINKWPIPTYKIHHALSRMQEVVRNFLS